MRLHIFDKTFISLNKSLKFNKNSLFINLLMPSRKRRKFATQQYYNRQFCSLSPPFVSLSTTDTS